MTEWNPELLHLHVAPGFGEFNAASIPDIRGEFSQATHWVANYFGNSVLSASYSAPQRQLVLAYLRRTQHAFAMYHAAREQTLGFLAVPSTGRYYAAVTDWEVFALDFSMACDIFHRGFGAPVFKKGDGSSEEQLYTLANNVKHPSSYLQEQDEALAAVPLWLTNDGLESYGGVTVKYEEACSILADASRIADTLQDPARTLKLQRPD
ncbi:MAG: hypothetical protein Q7J82_10190 [Coriobacteriia bacterium]|nr:hypothetical protein [Coriobacteriia bacterium]